jgi:hypothetical protein
MTRMTRQKLLNQLKLGGPMINPPSFMKELQKSKPRKPRVVKNKHPEELLQIQCCKWLETLPKTLFWSTPNHLWLGSNATYGQRMHYMSKQKAMGLKSGVADLTIIFRDLTGQTKIILIELKVKPNKLTEEQEKFLADARELGCIAEVVYSLDELKTILNNAKHRHFFQMQNL